MTCNAKKMLWNVSSALWILVVWCCVTPQLGSAQIIFIPEHYEKAQEIIIDVGEGLHHDISELMELAGVNKLREFLCDLADEQARWITDNPQKTKETYDAVGVGVGILGDELLGFTPVVVEEVPGGYMVTDWFGMGPIGGRPYTVSPQEAALTFLSGPSALLFGPVRKELAGSVFETMDDLLQLEKTLQKTQPVSPVTPSGMRSFPELPQPRSPFPPTQTPIEPKEAWMPSVFDGDKTELVHPLPSRFRPAEPGILNPPSVKKFDPISTEDAIARVDTWDKLVDQWVKEEAERKVGLENTGDVVKDFVKQTARLQKRTEISENMLKELSEVANRLKARPDGGGFLWDPFLSFLRERGLTLFWRDGRLEVDMMIQGSLLPIRATSNFEPAEETTYPVDPGSAIELEQYYTQAFG